MLNLSMPLEALKEAYRSLKTTSYAAYVLQACTDTTSYRIYFTRSLIKQYIFSGPIVDFTAITTSSKQNSSYENSPSLP